MANFDSFVQKTKAVAERAGQKTGELFELSKVNVNLIKLENDLDKLYQNIGKYICDNKEKGEALAADNLLCNYLRQVEQMQKVIEEKKLEKADLKNKTQCAACGAYNEKEAEYCSACGVKLSK